MEINPIIHKAVEILQRQFGGTDVKLISKEMYRLEPTEQAPAGALGVNIQIHGITTFLGYGYAEDLLTYGDPLAQDYIIQMLRMYNNQKNVENG